MTNHTLTVFALAALLAAGCATETSTKTVTVNSAGATQPPASSEPSFEPPDPKGRVTGICDYVLGDFTETKRGFRFVADVTIENTGNVGIVATAKASFKQLGGAPIVIKKPGIRIAYKQSKTVHLLHVATGNEIDLHQSADTGTGHACDTNATITDTWGETH